MIVLFVYLYIRVVPLFISSFYLVRIIGYGYGHEDTTKLKKYRTRDMTCIYMLSLTVSTNPLLTNIK